MMAAGVELLIIDETHHGGSKSGFGGEITAELKLMLDTGRVPIVLLGTEAVPILGIRPAGELAHLAPESIQTLWNERYVTQHRRAHGPRMLIAFDRAELAAAAHRWHTRVEPDTSSFQLGISRHGVEQLAALGTVEADAPGPEVRSRNFISISLEGRWLAWRIRYPACSDQRDQRTAKALGSDPRGARRWGYRLHADRRYASSRRPDQDRAIEGRGHRPDDVQPR